MDISNPGRNGVTAYFRIEIDGKITSVLYELDKNFDLVSSAYFQINEKKYKRECEHLSIRRRAPIKDCSKRD